MDRWGARSFSRWAAAAGWSEVAGSRRNVLAHYVRPNAAPPIGLATRISQKHQREDLPFFSSRADCTQARIEQVDLTTRHPLRNWFLSVPEWLERSLSAPWRSPAAPSRRSNIRRLPADGLDTAPAACLRVAFPGCSVFNASADPGPYSVRYPIRSNRYPTALPTHGSPAVPSPRWWISRLFMGGVLTISHETAQNISCPPPSTV